jgi:hypothetical protein
LLIKCTNCEKNFDYPNKEFNRRTKKGITQFFCGLSCSCKYRNANRSPELQEKMRRANIGNRYGEGNKKGIFTYYLNKSRNRNLISTLEEPDLDESYLESIWTGHCALSNIPINLKNNKNSSSLFDASLDRIDSSKGYTKGNVQFVALGINYAKNKFSDKELLTFLIAIKNQ